MARTLRADADARRRALFDAIDENNRAWSDLPPEARERELSTAMMAAYTDRAELQTPEVMGHALRLALAEVARLTAEAGR